MLDYFFLVLQLALGLYLGIGIVKMIEFLIKDSILRHGDQSPFYRFFEFVEGADEQRAREVRKSWPRGTGVVLALFVLFGWPWVITP